MLQPQSPPRIPDGAVPTVTIVEVGKEPTPGLSMIDVAVAAFGLTGVIMAAAVVAGITAGILYIWYARGAPSPSSRRAAASTTCSRPKAFCLFPSAFLYGTSAIVDCRFSERR